MNQPGSLTLFEQALQAEIFYYRQTKLVTVTVEDDRAWQWHQTMYAAAQLSVGAQVRSDEFFARFVLERHGYSLHCYMADHLSPQAWQCWFTHGGLLVPFR